MTNLSTGERGLPVTGRCKPFQYESPHGPLLTRLEAYQMVLRAANVAHQHYPNNESAAILDLVSEELGRLKEAWND